MKFYVEIQIRMMEIERISGYPMYSNKLPPMSIITTEKIFSHLVFADTFPNPTVVKEVHE